MVHRVRLPLTRVIPINLCLRAKAHNKLVSASFISEPCQQVLLLKNTQTHTNQKLSFLEAHMWHPCWKKAQLQPVCRDLSPSINTIMQWEKTYKPPIHQTYIDWLLIIKSAENHLLHTRFWKIYMFIHSFQVSHIPFCCRSMKHCPYNIKSR